MATIVKKILNGVNCDIAITDNVSSISSTVSELDKKINNLKSDFNNKINKINKYHKKYLWKNGGK